MASGRRVIQWRIFSLDSSNDFLLWVGDHRYSLTRSTDFASTTEVRSWPDRQSVTFRDIGVQNYNPVYPTCRFLAEKRTHPDRTAARFESTVFGRPCLPMTSRRRGSQTTTCWSTAACNSLSLVGILRSLLA